MTSFFTAIFLSPSRPPPQAPASTPRRKHLYPVPTPLKSKLVLHTASKPSRKKSVTFKVPLQEDTPPRLEFLSQATSYFDDDPASDDKENVDDELPNTPLNNTRKRGPAPKPTEVPLPSSSPTPSPSAGRSKRSRPSDDDESEVEFEDQPFDRFIAYRWTDDELELQVEWSDGSTTWEPEANLHQDAPDALFEYWNEIGGRPPNPEDATLYTVHKILKHSPNRQKVLVEWLGFGPDEATWERRDYIQKMVPDLSRQYWEAQRKKKRGRRRAAA